MDLKSGDAIEGDVSNGRDGALGLKGKYVGSISNKDLFFRANKIDLKRRVIWKWRKDRVWFGQGIVHACGDDAKKKKEEWEIDLAKLDIRNAIAHGTYGIVYKGTHDGQDVTDNFNNIFC